MRTYFQEHQRKLRYAINLVPFICSYVKKKKVVLYEIIAD